jgi:hypothetical protein
MAICSVVFGAFPGLEGCIQVTLFEELAEPRVHLLDVGIICHANVNLKSNMNAGATSNDIAKSSSASESLSVRASMCKSARQCEQ